MGHEPDQQTRSPGQTVAQKGRKQPVETRQCRPRPDRGLEAATTAATGTVAGFQKARNVERDPRVAICVSASDTPSRYYSIRGHVVDATTDDAAEHIEALAKRYLGTPHPSYGGRAQTRLMLTIVADSLHTTG